MATSPENLTTLFNLAFKGLLLKETEEYLNDILKGECLTIPDAFNMNKLGSSWVIRGSLV